MHTRSRFVDAKLNSHLGMADLLKFKYIMAIEGNDVSSGLKWMLFSNSVVFMPPITYESWAMESLLKPFVHYVPVYANMTNVVQMIKWAEKNQEECKKIAQRSSLFMYDLFFHPDSFLDDEQVRIGIMKRYEEQFRYRNCTETTCPDLEELRCVKKDTRTKITNNSECDKCHSNNCTCTMQGCQCTENRIFQWKNVVDLWNNTISALSKLLI